MPSTLQALNCDAAGFPARCINRTTSKSRGVLFSSLSVLLIGIDASLCEAIAPKESVVDVTGSHHYPVGVVASCMTIFGAKRIRKAEVAHINYGV